MLSIVCAFFILDLSQLPSRNGVLGDNEHTIHLSKSMPQLRTDFGTKTKTLRAVVISRKVAKQLFQMQKVLEVVELFVPTGKRIAIPLFRGSTTLHLTQCVSLSVMNQK